MINGYCIIIFQKFLSNIAETKEPHLLVSLENVLESIQKDFQDNDFELEALTDVPSVRDCAITYFQNKNNKDKEKFQLLGKIQQLKFT